MALAPIGEHLSQLGGTLAPVGVLPPDTAVVAVNEVTTDVVIEDSIGSGVCISF